MPYFGRWPDWLNLYLESCRWNPTVHWLFFTDCPTPLDVPENVHFKGMSFQEYIERASNVLKLRLCWTDPYKLCDLRPALGFLHQDEIRGYDYYGYGDIDVIYGNIRRIYTESVLEHLCISPSSNQVAGHFSLFQNCAAVYCQNTLIPIDMDVLSVQGRGSATSTRKENFSIFWCIDSKFSDIFLPGKNNEKSLLPYRSNNYFVEQFSTILCDMPWINGSMQHPEVWFWKEGSLTNAEDRDREFLYFHFMNWKSAKFLPSFRGSSAAWENIPSVNCVPKDKLREGWIMSRKGFHPIS